MGKVHGGLGRAHKADTTNIEEKIPPWEALSEYKQVAPFIGKIEDLKQKSDGDAVIGKSIDGFPIIIKVKRRHPVRVGMEDLVSKEVNELPPNVLQLIESCYVELDKYSLNLGIIRHEDKEYYETGVSLVDIFHHTILGSLLNPGRGDFTTLLNNHGENYEAVNELKNSVVKLAIPFDENDKVRICRRNAAGKIISFEPFFWETLDVLGSAEFTLTRSQYTHNTVYKGNLDDRDAYIRLYTLFKGLHLGLGSGPHILYSPQVILEKIIIPVIEQLWEKYHSRNIVMGDLKPENIVLLQNGVRIIDDGGAVEEGKICCTFTPYWGAPEQMLGIPVGLTADIYCVGKMIAAMFPSNCSFHGEVKQYIMPGSPNKIELFSANGFFIAPDITGLSKEGKLAWQSFLLKCCVQDASQRFTDAKELSLALHKLVAEHPLDKLPNLVLSINMGEITTIRGQKAVVRCFEDDRRDVNIFPL